MAATPSPTTASLTHQSTVLGVAVRVWGTSEHACDFSLFPRTPRTGQCEKEN